jgi:hypothetical protein
MFSTSARQGGTDTTAVTTAKKAGPGAEPHMQYSSSPAHFDAPVGKSMGAFHHGFPAAKRIWENEDGKHTIERLPRRLRTKAKPMVCVRSLRTQQRVKNRCQLPRLWGAGCMDRLVCGLVFWNENPLVEH